MNNSFEHLEGVELIYFVRADLNPVALIKISSTSSFGVRFAAMRAASPVELSVAGVIVCREDAVEREAKLRRRFGNCRAHHKWFHATPELISYITARAISPTSARGVGAPPLGVEAEQVLQEGARTLEPLVTIEQIADRLGVSAPTIRRYVRDRDVPFVRVGRQLRFDLREFSGVGAGSET